MWHCLWWSEKGTGIPTTGVTSSCEPFDKYWELKSSPLEDQQEFLTAEPPLWP